MVAFGPTASHRTSRMLGTLAFDSSMQAVACPPSGEPGRAGRTADGVPGDPPNSSGSRGGRPPCAPAPGPARVEGLVALVLLGGTHPEDAS